MNIGGMQLLITSIANYSDGWARPFLNFGHEDCVMYLLIHALFPAISC